MTNTMRPLTVAVHQVDGHAVSPDGQIDRLRHHLSGSRRGHDLIVCPELYLSGYIAGERFHERAEPLDGPCMRKIQDIAVGARCAIAYGFPERTSAGLYNSCALVGPDGQLLAVHRKTVFPHEYEQRYFVPGAGPTIVDWCGWKVGILICYEAEFPENVRSCALRGCDLVIVPTALSSEWSAIAQRMIPTRALENNVFVAYANYCGEAGDTAFLGESVIVDPWGNDLARAGHDETIVAAALDKTHIARARERLRFLSHLESLGDPQLA